MPDTVFGLPLHPLLVHAVVVLLPLAATGALAVAAVPRWMRPYGPLVAAGALAGAATAFVARLAGIDLAERLTLGGPVLEQVNEHARFGLYTVLAAWPFALLAVAAVVLERRAAGGARVTAWLAALGGLVALVLTVVTGHSGSSAVWNPGG